MLTSYGRGFPHTHSSFDQLKCIKASEYVLGIQAEITTARPWCFQWCSLCVWVCHNLLSPPLFLCHEDTQTETNYFIQHTSSLQIMIHDDGGSHLLSCYCKQIHAHDPSNYFNAVQIYSILSKYIMLWLDFIKCVGNLAIPGYILYI